MMASGTAGRGRLATASATLLLLHGILAAHAHHCGPSRVQLRVGEACPWKITADLTEVDSLYAPVLEGPTRIVDVTPLKNFQARHGDFILVGKAPGTNVLSVAWGYPPTGAFGVCDVEIVVTTNAPSTGSLETVRRMGLISTRSGTMDITAPELKSLLDEFIPAAAPKLLIFTQCFGGNIAQDPSFVDAPNLAIASATSPNQTGKYGGYHDDAARALKPVAGRTALDVHQISSQGKMTAAPPPEGVTRSKDELLKSSEWTRSAGGLALSEFPLDPVGSGRVKSRHVVVFMGQPEAKNVLVQTHDGNVTIPSAQGTEALIDDNADRDAIKANFLGQPNTTVRTAGGQPNPENPAAGQNGWDFPGDVEGLKKALREAGDAIRNSPDPAAEQFIFFVGDHGSEGVPLFLISKPLAIGASLNFSLNLGGLVGKLELQKDILPDYSNIPTISVQVSPAPSPPNANAGGPAIHAPAASPTFGLQLELLRPNRPALVFTEFRSGVFDLNDDGIVSAARGEHATLAFPIPESLLLRDLFEGPVDIVVRNTSSTALTVSAIHLTTGSLSKPNYTIPTPIISEATLGTDRRLALTIIGPTGETFDLMTSSDLLVWTRARSVIFNNEVIQVFLNPTALGRPQFVRLQKPLPRLP